jgi:hypothetical protein
MIKHKIRIPVIVLTLARKKLFLRWALEGFKRSKIAAREIQLNSHQARNIGHVHCYFD